jgi:hypothetical protein
VVVVAAFVMLVVSSVIVAGPEISADHCRLVVACGLSHFRAPSGNIGSDSPVAGLSGFPGAGPIHCATFGKLVTGLDFSGWVQLEPRTCFYLQLTTLLRVIQSGGIFFLPCDRTRR